MHYSRFLDTYFRSADGNDPIRLATYCGLLIVQQLSRTVRVIPESSTFDKRNYDLPEHLCESIKELHYLFSHPSSDLVKELWVEHAAASTDKIVYWKGKSGINYVPTWHLYAWSLGGEFLDGICGYGSELRKAKVTFESLTQESLQRESGAICSHTARFVRDHPIVKRIGRIELGMWREYARAAQARPSGPEGRNLPRFVPKYESLTEAERRITDVLTACGRRLTTVELLAELEKKHGATSEGTTKQTLAIMVRNGLLTNRRNPRPRGYGLFDWKD